VKFLQNGEQSTGPICLESLETTSVLSWKHRFAAMIPDLEIKLSLSKEAIKYCLPSP
jgi:hypothetical protein